MTLAGRAIDAGRLLAAMNIHPSLRLYSYSRPATDGELAKLAAAYPTIPDAYVDLVRQATNVVLLWNNQGELRIWGPEEVIAMDAAYGASARMPGAMPFADNGGGQWLVHGQGQQGPGAYLVDTGSMDLDEYAPWVCRDLTEMLTKATGAELVFQSDPIDESDLGAPFYQDPTPL
jgi:hypothetical protein